MGGVIKGSVLSLLQQCNELKLELDPDLITEVMPLDVTGGLIPCLA